MRRFRFALEGLLRVRRINQEKQLRALEEVSKELQKIDGNIASINAEREEQMEKLVAVREGKIETSSLLSRQRYLNVLANQGVSLRNQRLQVAGRVQEAQRNLERATRECDVVESLRERRLQEHQREVAREETQELDEIGRARFHALLNDEESVL